MLENPKDIFISPKIVENMIKNYKLPKQNFDLNETLKALAQNKHNDLTTTYYLLHKKQMKNSEITDLVKITPSNFEDIAFRI